METKKFISTVKGFRTRFTNKPDAQLEEKSVLGVCEKIGGSSEAIELLEEANETELLEYVSKVLGGSQPGEDVEEAPSAKVEKPTKKSNETVVAKGNIYEIDPIKKTCKRVYKDLAALAELDLDVPEMSMTVYQRYLKDHFEGESATIKKGSLYFRGYRISCTVENGFMVEDSTKRYAVVETSFEGIPTPKELGEFFKKPAVEHTPEELKAAVERGKELAKVRETPVVELEEVVEINYEALRKKVLRTIKGVQEKRLSSVDPETFTDMIPFKRWKRKVNALIKEWKSRKIRYAKFLTKLKDITEAETFEVEEKTHRSEFVGTCLPEFTTIGRLLGDKLEVDNKLVDAVPFMLDYILHYVPKAMQQIMRYADGEISDLFLVKNPFHNDWKIEFKKRSFANTSHNAQVLTCLCESIGLVAPQDLLYEADLKVGDKIMIYIDDAWRTKQITQIEEGICINKGVGVTKLDKWIKLPQ